MARGLNIFVGIGARLLPSLNSSVSSAEKRFVLMGRRLRVIGAETKLLNKELTSASSGLLGLAAAGGLTFGVAKAIGDGAHLAHELQLLRNAGRTSNEVAEAMTQSWRTLARLPTTTLADNLAVLNETTGAFGSFHHALENLTFNQRVGSMMQNMLSEAAGSPGEMFNNLVRAMEMRGTAQNSRIYQREVGELYRAMVFTRGRVNPEEFFNFAQQANPYIKGISTRYMTKIAPSLIQEFGGDRAGTMFNTWMGTILGKAKNKIQTEAWMKLGLLDPRQVVYNKVGPVGWRPGAIKGTDLAMRDPLAWSEQVLIPALLRQGFKVDDQLSLAKALMPLFRDRNANRLANVLVYDRDRQRLHKDERLINQVPTAGKAYEDSLRRDPTMSWAALKGSANNLGAAIFGIGKDANFAAVAMANIARRVNGLAGIIAAHPWLQKGLATVLLGGAGLAGLRLFGIGLRFILAPLNLLLSPLRAVGGLIWRAFGPMAFRGLLRFGTALAPAFRAFGSFAAAGMRALGPFFMAGMRALGPFLLTGLRLAFGLLSGPVGWAILAASAVLLVWRYRQGIANAWHSVVNWFRTKAWPMVRDTVKSIDWKGVGLSIADALTFGLASKLPELGRRIRGWWSGQNASTPQVAGARALGGPVRRGRAYLVGERGPELFRAPGDGLIVPADRTAAMLNGRRPSRVIMPARSGRDRRDAGAPIIFKGDIKIYDARDPMATAREVRRALNAMAGEQAAYMTD